MSYHTPVLFQDCLDGLRLRPDGTYVDVTFGGGGHSRGILAQLGEKGRLFAFDQDPDSARNAPDDERFTLIPQNFRFIKNFLRMYRAIPAMVFWPIWVFHRISSIHPKKAFRFASMPHWICG